MYTFDKCVILGIYLIYVDIIFYFLLLVVSPLPAAKSEGRGVSLGENANKITQNMTRAKYSKVLKTSSLFKQINHFNHQHQQYRDKSEDNCPTASGHRHRHRVLVKDLRKFLS